jgi:transcriptional regulator with XRE-family HTH domain
LLGRNTGIDFSFLAHLETRSKSPSLAVLAKIIGALRVSPEELFWTASGNEEKLARRLLSLVRGMKRGQRDDVLAVLSKLRDPRRARALRLALGA